MCKAWNCTIDDQRFQDITEHQWGWYAQMILEDDQAKFEYNLDIVDYLASFWNSEAVQQVRNIREARNDERFQTDEEFEQQVREGDFRENDDLVRAIRDKYKNTNLDGTIRSRDARSTRLPKDMSRLHRIAEDKID